ncbi:MAG: hypothetical protein ACTIKR_07585 [Advenella sp.]|uniref:Uncharacterized protein n=1 Tax=Advenella kashmirensis TaxID=310575 RepID=A0A356LIT9_9BURK|nr:hypothetical protein [Advenella kashmirensis]
MNAIFSFLSGWKDYAVATGLVIFAACGYGRWQYHAGHANAVQEHKVADLEQYRQTANELQTASQKTQTALDTTQTKLTTFQETYQNEMRVNPIDCVDANSRLRSILDIYPPATTGKFR